MVPGLSFRVKTGGNNLAGKNTGNITKYRKPLNINLGMLFFLGLLIYIIICMFMYFSSKHIIGYEVKAGSLSITNIYEGIAFRDETIINSEYSGYINYYARENEKVGANNIVCSVDETGQLNDMISKQENENGNILSEKDLSEIKNDIINFSNAFNCKNFSSVYDFKFSIEGNVLKFTNRNLLRNLSELNEKNNSGLINLCNAPTSGIVIYSVDGYENKTPQQINEDWFKKDKYEKNQLINNEIVDKDDPIYKLATKEAWYIMIPVEEKRAEELLEEDYVKVKFLKNQYESWAKVEVIKGADKKTYVKLNFTNSMITFATDRFLDIELITDVESGLKVPNTAIVEKEFFLIPTVCITKGGNSNSDGVMRETYNENGEMIPEFVPVTIYNEADGEYYVDDMALRIGDNIRISDSQEHFTISKAGTLIGVYNINKGYADFKQIQILNQNEEYAIIKSNTKYGLVPYDYIVLDASSVEDDEFIFE